MEYLLATSPWYGVILWIILYISDYYLTIYAARGFREIGHFQFEGSMELTPQFQNDIDNLRPVSRLHLTLLVIYSLFIIFVWGLAQIFIYFDRAYLFFLGMFLLLEVAVHVRHLRNINIIREARKNGGIDGQIAYRKWFSYRISAGELYSLAGVFLIAAILTYSFFFLGGTVACFAIGLQHSRLAKKAKSAPTQVIETQP